MGVISAALRPWLAGAALLLPAAGLLPACGGGQEVVRTVSLHMQGKPETATVTIDDAWLGPLARVTRRGVALPPGRHRITVEAPGFFPWDRLVEVKDGDPPVSLDVALIAVPE